MSTFLAAFAPYRKTVAALVAAVVTWLSVAYVPDGHITRAEWYGLIVALAGVLGVFVAPNEPKPAALAWQPSSQSDEGKP